MNMDTIKEKLIYANGTEFILKIADVDTCNKFKLAEAPTFNLVPIYNLIAYVVPGDNTDIIKDLSKLFEKHSDSVIVLDMCVNTAYAEPCDATLFYILEQLDKIENSFLTNGFKKYKLHGHHDIICYNNSNADELVNNTNRKWNEINSKRLSKYITVRELTEQLDTFSIPDNITAWDASYLYNSLSGVHDKLVTTINCGKIEPTTCSGCIIIRNNDTFMSKDVRDVIKNDVHEIQFVKLPETDEDFSKTIKSLSDEFKECVLLIKASEASSCKNVDSEEERHIAVTKGKELLSNNGFVSINDFVGYEHDYAMIYMNEAGKNVLKLIEEQGGNIK